MTDPVVQAVIDPVESSTFSASAPPAWREPIAQLAVAAQALTALAAAPEPRRHDGPGHPFAPEWDRYCRRYCELLEQAGMVDPLSSAAQQNWDAHLARQEAAAKLQGRRPLSDEERQLLVIEWRARQEAAPSGASANHCRQALAARGIAPAAIVAARHAIPLDREAPPPLPSRWSTRSSGQIAREEPWARAHREAAAVLADPATAAAQKARWEAGNRRAELAAGSAHKSRGRGK